MAAIAVPWALCGAFLSSQYVIHRTWLSVCIVVSKRDAGCEIEGESEGEGNLEKEAGGCC